MTKVPEIKVRKQVQDDMSFWFPVIMGIATREEMESCTLKQLQILNEVANQKYKLTIGGVTETDG